MAPYDGAYTTRLFFSACTPANQMKNIGDIGTIKNKKEKEK